MYKGQSEDLLLQALMSRDMKNVAGSIGLFDLPREEDVVCVRSGVATEMLKRNAKSVM